MADNPLSEVLGSFRSRLHAEMDAQFQALTDSHEQALDTVRRGAEAEAEQRWMMRTEEVRAELAVALDAGIAAARDDARRQAAVDRERAQLDLEQAASENVARMRREIEDTLLKERHKLEDLLNAERARTDEAVHQAEAARVEQQRAVEALEQARREVEQAAAHAERAAAERQRLEQALEAERAQHAEAAARAQAALADRQGLDEALALARAQSTGALGQIEAAGAEHERMVQVLDAERARAAEIAASMGALVAERQRVEQALEAERLRAGEAVAQAQTAVADRERVELALEEQRASAVQALADARALQADNGQRTEALEAEQTRAAQAAEQLRVATDQCQIATESREHAEQALTESRAALEASRGEAERSLAVLRADLDAERRRSEQAALESQSQLTAERQRAEAALDEARRQAVDERRLADAAAIDLARTTASPAIDVSTLLDAFRSINAAQSLTDALAAAVTAAARQAPRAALFLRAGSHLEEWAVPGVPRLSPGMVPAAGPESGVLGEVLDRQEPVWTTGNGAGPQPPRFALLPSGRTAIAAPLLLAGHPVAVLYADEAGEHPGHTSWRESIQILATHASACLAYLTAARTAQAMRLLSEASARTATTSAVEDEGAARRFARLLVAEVRLYNESAVRLGREHRDLLQRLRPELERARRLYDERIPASVTGRDAFFQQEVLQTLADGDASLLG